METGSVSKPDTQASVQAERFTVEKCLKEAYRLHRSEVKSMFCFCIAFPNGW